jgi:[ribosomal protein S5]-alanine N-acetyltransferase
MHAIPDLTTDRLLLRPFTAEDSDRVTELLQRPEIAATTLNIEHPYPEGAAASWIASHAGAAEAGEAFTWAICRREDGLLMGAIGIHIDDRHRRGTIGYWLGVPYWNQGFTTEATRAVIDLGFAALDLHRIEATCLPHNVGSSRVMEKAGMTHEGTLRGYFQKEGEFGDVAMYAVIREGHA